MIKIQESVPSVYYDSSRDFQLIGHLFDLVLNSTKTEADLIFNLPLSTNSDDQLLDLLAFTLGLRLSKEKYTSKQLRAVCSVAPRMMRNKGSKQAIELLCNALMRADSIEGSSYVELTNHELIVHITNISTCHDILQELLPYIVPAGIVFNIKEMTNIEADLTTTLSISDNVKYGIHDAAAMWNYAENQTDTLESQVDFVVPADNPSTVKATDDSLWANHLIFGDFIEESTEKGDNANE